jgi:F-type H+-transporting ATPase subunit epsilon
MVLEIVTPEFTIFKGEVESVSVPGVDGQFQMLDNHAPVVSLLTKGTVKIFGSVSIPKNMESKFQKADGTTNFAITGGVLEMAGNKAIVLAD